MSSVESGVFGRTIWASFWFFGRLALESSSYGIGDSQRVGVFCRASIRIVIWSALRLVGIEGFDRCCLLFVLIRKNVRRSGSQKDSCVYLMFLRCQCFGSSLSATLHFGWITCPWLLLLQNKSLLFLCNATSNNNNNNNKSELRLQ
jgi:hypothetical protein